MHQRHFYKMCFSYKKIISFIFLCLHSLSCSSKAYSNQDVWNANQYEKHNQADKNFSNSFVQGISLKGDEKILDVGCGDGRIAAQLAKQVPQGEVIGLDPSASMIAFAKNFQKQEGIKNVDFLQGNAENFVLKNKFDVIIAIHVLHWLVDPETALKNIYNHLQPGGKVYFMLAMKKGNLSLENALRKTMNAQRKDFENFQDPIHPYDMEELRQLLLAAGFQVDKLCYSLHEEDFKSKATLFKWLEQWLPHYKFLRKEKRAKFLNDAIDNYLLENAKSNNRKIIWREYIMTVEATKAR